MKFYLRYGGEENPDEFEEKFDREEEMIAKINELAVKYPNMHFRAFYGRELKLVPNQIVASYKVEK